MGTDFWSVFWTTFFSWPQGGVWSNLLANVIWGLPAVLFIIRKIKKHLDEKHESFLTYLGEKAKQEYRHLDKEHLHDVLPDLGDDQDKVDL